jgi:hypothetical protein
MVRDLTEEQLEHITNFGALNYSPDRMSNVLEIPVNEITEMMKDPDSIFSIFYNKGLHRFDYVIDIKLMEQAQAGDIKSLEKLELRKRMRKS